MEVFSVTHSDTSTVGSITLGHQSDDKFFFLVVCLSMGWIHMMSHCDVHTCSTASPVIQPSQFTPATSRVKLSGKFNRGIVE
jgi:hypothetical protein